MNRRELLAGSAAFAAGSLPLRFARINTAEDSEWTVVLGPWGFPLRNYPNGVPRSEIRVERIWTSMGGVTDPSGASKLLIQAELGHVGFHSNGQQSFEEWLHWAYRAPAIADAVWFNNLAYKMAHVMRNEMLIEEGLDVAAVLENEGHIISAMLTCEALRLSGYECSFYAVVDARCLGLDVIDLMQSFDFIRQRAKSFQIWNADDIPRSPDEDWCYRYSFLSDAIGKDEDGSGGFATGMA